MRNINVVIKVILTRPLDSRVYLHANKGVELSESSEGLARAGRDEMQQLSLLLCCHC